jgi:hypothetical protein
VSRTSLPWPYRGGNEGKSVRTGRRRSRRTWRQTQSSNGAAVMELNTGGPGDDVRWRALPLGLLLRYRASTRARREAEAVRDRVEIKASRRLHAVSSTVHERHATSSVCRGGQQRARASGRGRRPRGHGPGHGAAAGTRGGEDRAALASGPKGKRRPATVRNDFSIFISNKFSNKFN